MAPPGEQIKFQESQGHFICDFEAVGQVISKNHCKEFLKKMKKIIKPLWKLLQRHVVNKLDNGPSVKRIRPAVSDNKLKM